MNVVKTLIAAAGNAGAGGPSYWVNEVDINNSDSPSIRMSASEDRGSVIVRSQRGSTSKLIEIDNAGDYLRSGSETASSNCYAFIPFNGNYLFQANFSTDSRLWYFENGTSSTAFQYSYNGLASSVPISMSHGRNALSPGLTSDTVCYSFGKRDYYYAGPYVVWTPYLYVSANHEPLASPATNGARQFVGQVTLGDTYFWQQAVSKNTYNGKYSVCWMESFSQDKIHVADIDGTNTSSERRSISTVDTPENIFVDSTGKTTILARTTNHSILLRGSTAGSLSSITSTYKFFTGSNGSVSVIDSNGNIYILTAAMKLFKFTTSNTIEWSLSLTDSRGSTAGGYDMVLGTEDDTEFLYIVQTADLNSSPINYKLYIWKLPLDANNYTGTYGTYTISSFANPTITSGSISNGSPTYSSSAKTMSNTAINSPTQAPELTTHTTTVTPI